MPAFIGSPAITTTPNPAAGANRPCSRLLSRTLRLGAGVALALFLPPALHAAPLNDSGIQFCGEYPGGNTAAPCTPDPEGQDAAFGGDAAAQAGVRYKVGGGSAGFDYTRIANNGSELDASATLGSGASDWACTRDNTTGRVWEVKVDDAAHLRHQDHTYTWYFNPSPDGTSGVEGNTTSCGATLGVQNCNTSTFAAAVNAAGLCGFGDWRVPTAGELKNLVDHGRSSPAIDPTFFPNTPASSFWSAAPSAASTSNAWFVGFDVGNSGSSSRGGDNRARLVRGGQ